MAWSVVELDEEDGNLFGREQEPLLRLEGEEEAEARQRLIRSVAESLPEPDRRVLELMQHGERRTAVYAEVCACADRPADEQARLVKRVKDRLKKRVQRGSRP